MGMDTHVKEGQLYVQHQKFGKVSPRRSCGGVAVALTQMTLMKNKCSQGQHDKCFHDAVQYKNEKISQILNRNKSYMRN